MAESNPIEAVYPKYISKLNPNSDLGFVLEVDLEYPEKLHDLHDNYPLAPENMVVPHEWFSEYQRELLDDSNVSDPHVNKLTCTLNPKHKYVVHIATLQKYLELGLTLTKVHRAMSFKQKPWMRSYIDKNTRLRTQAQSDFGKDFFKLMNNSVFGKTMENVRNRVSGFLFRDEDAAAF